MITLTQAEQPPHWVLCQQPAEGLRKIRTGSEHNESTRIISHLHKLWLGISWVMLFSSLALCLFHKCLQHISKPTSVSHTHPEVMISTACCLLAGRNIFFWASTLHLPPLGLLWRRTWTVTLHLLYSWLYQCLSHSCLIIPFPEESSPLFTHSVHGRFFLSLITIFTAHPCTSSNFIIPIRDREHIPDIATHGCLQQYDGSSVPPVFLLWHPLCSVNALNWLFL